MQGRYSAGDNVASYCTKCRLVLDHTVVAMDGERIAKVKCRTCGSVHRFRNPGDPPADRKPKEKKAGASGAAAQWETAMAGSSGNAQPYRMDAKYSVGDVVDHDRFGRGVVRELFVNKCEVLFRDGERLMASGN